MDEVAAGAVKGVVADEATAIAEAETTAREVTRALAEIAEARSRATAAAKRGTSSPSAPRKVKSVASAARWGTCKICVSRRPRAVLQADLVLRKLANSRITMASHAL